MWVSGAGVPEVLAALHGQPFVLVIIFATPWVWALVFRGWGDVFVWCRRITVLRGCDLWFLFVCFGLDIFFCFGSRGFSDLELDGGDDALILW